MIDSTAEGTSRPPIRTSRVVLFWTIALAGAGFDLATKAYAFKEIGDPSERRIVTVVNNVLELQTSHNRGALWGFMRDVPHSSLLFAVLPIVAAWASGSGCSGSARPRIAA